MSGPVTATDALAGDPARPSPTTFEVTESRATTVGSVRVRRALPRRARRTVGPWCFVDHLGPVAVDVDDGVDVGPHPHTGLHTVTWLLAGEVLHRDSLGSEQVLRPGQLNLMTAGSGVAHAEERTGRYRGDLHGVQLWVAQPEATRHGAPAFEHHAELPVRALPGANATVLVGDLDGTVSPARRETGQVGVDLSLAGAADVPLRATFEHAVVVLDGAVSIEGGVVGPGALAYLGTGRDELRVATAGGDGARVLLIGGAPFDEPLLMWWNFVARTRQEITDAYRAWERGDERFGPVASRLDRIPVGPPPWARGPTPEPGTGG